MTDGVQATDGVTRAADGTIIEPIPTETKTQETQQQSQTTDQTKATETKTAETGTEKKDEGKSVLNQGDTKAEAKPGGAPEKYEAFSVPDGFTLDEAVATEAGTLFKELNLSQGQAQKLVDFHVAKTQEAFDAPFKAWKEQNEKWATELTNDPVIGGKLQEVKTTISKAIDTTVGLELGAKFREAMDYTGAGNHPIFARVFYELAKQLTEGGHVAGNGPSPHGQRKPGEAAAGVGANALYPHLP